MPDLHDLSPHDNYGLFSGDDLEDLIRQAIRASASDWNDFVAINTASTPMCKADGTRISKPLVMKYVPTNRAKDYLPAHGHPPLTTPADVYRNGVRSPTPNFFIGDNFYTWGKAVYVVGINQPLSTAIYGRVGMVAALNLSDEQPWSAFDVRYPVHAALYLEWLRRQPHYPVAALTFDTGHWLHGLRNKFRADFKIDVVMCKPDEQDAAKWYTAETDTWLCVGDFEPADIPGKWKLVDQNYSQRFHDVRMVIVGEEEFVTPVNPKNPPRAPDPPASRAAELELSGGPPLGVPMQDIADAYWQGEIVRVQS